MKTIFKIAKTELQVLFFSPVAWFILIVFTIQSFLSFTKSVDMVLQSQEMGWGMGQGTGVSFLIFGHPKFGFLKDVLQYLHLYIPLLTMGLMSRELGSGSIKLLYSSPISNIEIILGKYLSMVIYGLILVLILLGITSFMGFYIPEYDYPPILVALLGIYLLICTYAAIGLFMSCFTSYQVVAAIMTLSMLAILSMIRNWGQEYEFMRNITYWLSMSGRVNQFQAGLICSEDVLYFILVPLLFLTFSVIKLNANRQKTRWTVSISKYIGSIAIICIVGYITTLPTMKKYYDATAVKRNTLTENSQKIVSQLKEKLTITAYVNGLDLNDIYFGLPANRMRDRLFWEQYIRFKPDIKLKYVLYYDSIPRRDLTTQFPGKKLTTLNAQLGEICRIYDADSTLFISGNELKKEIDLLPEGNKFVRRLQTESGKETFLRVFNDHTHVPTETEISAAFKRLVMKLPTVAFATGQGERNYNGNAERDYSFSHLKSFRYALINQGFDVAEVRFDTSVPNDINIIVLPEMKRPFNETEQKYFDEYIARGGNLILFTEPRRTEAMSNVLAQFGVRQLPGVLVHPSKNLSPDLTIVRPTKKALEHFYQYYGYNQHNGITMPTAAPIEYDTDKGYDVFPVLETDSTYWNELETTDFVDDSVSVNSAIGEVQRRYTTGLALSRQQNNKEQKILIFSDADCLSNGELNATYRELMTRNFDIITASFFWLSDNEVPIDIRRPSPTDNKLSITKQIMKRWKVIIHWGIPVLFILTYLFIWLRRKGR